MFAGRRGKPKDTQPRWGQSTLRGKGPMTTDKKKNSDQELKGRG